MSKRCRHLLPLTALGALALAAAGAMAQEAAPETSDDSTPFSPLGLKNRPITLPDWRGDGTGALRLGLGYTSDDNYMFGEYNGLSKQGPTAIADLQWQDFHSSENYWQVSMQDMGLDTRQGKAIWGRADRLKLTLGFDSQSQVRNDSGETPFRGNTTQTLPANWVSGLTTSDFTTLQGALQGFDRTLDRDKAYMAIDAKIDEHWSVNSNLSYEHKEGHGDAGAGIYIDSSSADSVLLRTPVDYGTTEFNVGAAYDDDRLHMNGQLAYSKFDNEHQLLEWQNPYSSYGSDVAYPAGIGGLALAPDNEQSSGRLMGSYLFSPALSLQFDGSYAMATQNQNFAPYTVNPALTVTVPVPLSDLNGEVDTTTGNVKLLWNPAPKLNTEWFYRLRDRDYNNERNGYLYVRGDGSDQPDSPMTVYDTTHDMTTQTAGAEASYRLPLHSKLSFEYDYEQVERHNAAVEKTQEDRYTLGYRIQPWPNFSSRLQLLYGDRAADDYQWAQSYYALLDSQLINVTPDNQRYINHPLLMDYYMANRERWESSADFTYLPTDRWNLNLNLLWRDDNYDASQLGLTDAKWYRTQFSASYAMSTTLSGSVYTGYDNYQTNQYSRTFNGGPEKNAFAIYPPLPQASDPQQNWQSDGTDTSVTLGANLQWQAAPDLQFKVDYSYVDTRNEQQLTTEPGASVTASDLPNVNTRLHHFQASAIWQLRPELSLQFDYQYYYYKTDDWAWNNVQVATIDKVLTFGQTNPNEDIQYVGASVIYRWH
jgi:MtrB/PioB family decaheme-associated outer membrane protein